MTLLKSVERVPIFESAAHFPYTLPFVRALTWLDFTAPVTFLVGENGSGKSTFLEAIACAADSITVGRESVQTDPTLAAVREFSRELRLSWSKRTRKGLFMRAEDFFGYAQKMAQTRAELKRDVEQIDHEFKGRSKHAIALAKSPLLNEIGAMQRDYGDGLDHQSHGESFFKLFSRRFTGEGLYLLDEPEAPLSPTRQLSFITMMKAMVDQKAQLIIATHSPIIMAYPGAQILNFDGGKIEPIEYEALEHVVVTRSFLNDPQSYLRHLLA